MNLKHFLNQIGLQELPNNWEWRSGNALATLTYNKEPLEKDYEQFPPEDGEPMQVPEVEIELYELDTDDGHPVGSARFVLEDGRLVQSASSSEGFLDSWIECIRSFG